ncbi:hypothetical protein HAX54_004132, partial [Datura stramonium]|nr:hypothetical protein [Datura stramonium]
DEVHRYGHRIAVKKLENPEFCSKYGTYQSPQHVLNAGQTVLWKDGPSFALSTRSRFYLDVVHPMINGLSSGKMDCPSLRPLALTLFSQVIRPLINVF